MSRETVVIETAIKSDSLHQPVVIGILKQNDKFLITERPRQKVYGGYWEFPGGKIEANESSLDALKRELREELGISVVTARLWFQHQHNYDEKSFLLDVWLVTEFVGSPVSNEDQQLLWASLSEIAALPILEGNWVIINSLQNGQDALF